VAGWFAGRGDVVLVHQAYRFALDPTPAQEQALLSHCGATQINKPRQPPMVAEETANSC
jgi:hypothetical protein